MDPTASPPASPPSDHEVATFVYPHKILAIGNNLADPFGSDPHRFEMYDWASVGYFKAPLCVSMRIPPELLSVIKDSVALGPVWLDPDAEMPIPSSYHALARSHVDDDVVMDSGALADALKDLGDGGENVGEEPDILRNFYVFPLLSNKPDLDLRTTQWPVWKWTKPDSPDRKAGFWETHLPKALEHGERNAGQELTLLMAPVSERVYRTILNSEVKFTNLVVAKEVSWEQEQAEHDELHAEREEVDSGEWTG